MSGRRFQHFVSVRCQKLGFVHIFTQILNNLAMQLCYAMAEARERARFGVVLPCQRQAIYGVQKNGYGSLGASVTIGRA